MPAKTITDIKELIQKNPGATARQIANKLGLSRKEINSILYANLGTMFHKSEEGHRWYLPSQSEVLSSSLSLNANRKKSHIEKDVIITHSNFPGHSLFSIKYDSKTISMKINEGHDFFDHLKHGLDQESACNLLLQTLAMALEPHYTEIDFIEEIVGDWGFFLSKKLKEN